MAARRRSGLGISLGRSRGFSGMPQKKRSRAREVLTEAQNLANRNESQLKVQSGREGM